MLSSSLLVVRPCGTVYQLHFDWRTCHCLYFVHGWKHFWWQATTPVTVDMVHLLHFSNLCHISDIHSFINHNCLDHHVELHHYVASLQMLSNVILNICRLQIERNMFYTEYRKIVWCLLIRLVTGSSSAESLLNKSIDVLSFNTRCCRKLVKFCSSWTIMKHSSWSKPVRPHVPTVRCRKYTH